MTEPSSNTPQSAENQGKAAVFPDETVGNFSAENSEQTPPAAEALESDKQHVQDAVVAASERKEFSPEEIAQIEATAVDGYVRKAPRISAFFWTGALVGIVLGLILGVILTQVGSTNRWIEITVTVAFTTMVTVMIAGALVILLDRKSIKKASEDR